MKVRVPLRKRPSTQPDASCIVIDSDSETEPDQLDPPATPPPAASVKQEPSTSESSSSTSPMTTKDNAVTTTTRDAEVQTTDSSQPSPNSAVGPESSSDDSKCREELKNLRLNVAKLLKTILPDLTYDQDRLEYVDDVIVQMVRVNVLGAKPEESGEVAPLTSSTPVATSNGNVLATSNSSTPTTNGGSRTKSKTNR